MIKELSVKTGLDDYELTTILEQSISKVYGGYNNALILENGAILVAIKDENKDEFDLKHYVISNVKFSLILKRFKKDLEHRIIEEDGIYFYNKNKNKIFNVNEVIRINNFKSLIKINTNSGVLRTTKIEIKNSDKIYCTRNREFLVKFKSYNANTNTILATSNDKKIFEYIFNKKFYELNELYGVDFKIHNLRSIIDKKNNIKFLVHFSKEPNGYFISKLLKKLKEVFNSVEIIKKIVKKKN